MDNQVAVAENLYYVQNKAKEADALLAELVKTHDTRVLYVTGDIFNEYHRDEKVALAYYKKGLKKGDVLCRFGIARLSDDKHKDKNLPKAFPSLIQMAESGDALAQIMAGYCYHYGKGVEKNNKLAVEWTRKAAEQGYCTAQCNMGLFYYTGEGVEKDEELAVEWYRKAAEKGHSKSQLNLGASYYDGSGVEKNHELAVKWFEKAAEQGNRIAQYNLGYCSYYGKGVEKNITVAVEWYQKAAAQGYAKAQEKLGECYINGEGVEVNLEIASEWLKKAAEQGERNAQYFLGEYYYSAYKIGVKSYLSRAVEWLTKAAEQGDFIAQHRLGLLYSNGEGVEKDKVLAAEWFKKAAEQGYDEAQALLGSCYFDGDGVEKDIALAIEWFTQAAEQGHIWAQNRLGLCYSNGEGVGKDLELAAKWYRKAAEQGYDIAQYNLGSCYFEGDGVEKDLNLAVEWHTKAAEQGYLSAQFWLGMYYYRGVETERNMALATKWFIRAAEQGHSDVQSLLCSSFYSVLNLTNNFELTFDDFARLANLGNPSAQLYLGRCYRDGNGVERDCEKAIHWFTKAAEQNDYDAKEELETLQYIIEYEKALETLEQPKIPDFRNLTLGQLLYHKDNKESWYWLGMAYKARVQLDDAIKWLTEYINITYMESKGFVDKPTDYLKETYKSYYEAVYELAECYLMSGKNQNKDKALKLFEKMPDNALAQVNAGLLYYFGTEFKMRKNIKKGREYVKLGLSTILGNGELERLGLYDFFAIAWMYQDECNIDKAKEFYRLAIDRAEKGGFLMAALEAAESIQRLGVEKASEASRRQGLEEKVQKKAKTFSEDDDLFESFQPDTDTIDDIYEFWNRTPPQRY